MLNDFVQKVTNENKYLDFLKEIDKEVEHNSDRGIALIFVSVIDQLLTELLKSFFIKSKKIDNDLFKSGGSLSNLDSKMKIAFYLGLISENELSNITYLQRIRNKFAHEITGISFTSNDIKNMSSHLNIPKNSFTPQFLPLPTEGVDELPHLDLNPIKKDTPAKDRFIFTFRYLYMNLMTRVTFGVLGNRTEYKESHTADVSALMAVDKLKEAINECESLIGKTKTLLEEKKKLLDKLKF